MSNPFQYIIDKAQDISINRRAIVAATTTRDQTIRTVSRGGQVWRFDVTVPDGLAWTDLRPVIEAMDKADRYTPSTIQLSNPGYSSWLSAYQGDATSLTGFNATVTSGDTITLTSTGVGLSPGKNTFKAGDFIQLGPTGRVYTVANTVTYPNTQVQLNRPIYEAAGSYPLIIGPNVSWQVVCVQFPDWKIIRRNQIGWTGTFKFQESYI